MQKNHLKRRAINVSAGQLKYVIKAYIYMQITNFTLITRMYHTAVRGALFPSTLKIV